MSEKEFPKERNSISQVFPAPLDGETVKENPPALIWLLPPCDEAASEVYHVSIVDENGTSVFEKDMHGNCSVPDRLLAPGKYRWNVFCPSFGTEHGWQSFVVPENAVRFLRPTADEVLAGLSRSRPRHLFNREDIPELRVNRSAEIETIRRNIEQAYRDGMPERPMFHRNEKSLPYREYFGYFRDFCDRNLVACALGYQILEDEAERKKAGDFARELFLTICDWNPAGPCSQLGMWGDEVGLSCSRCFPAVFDLLYERLDRRERLYCAETVAAYAYQCERRLDDLKYTQNPGSSHAGRIPAYMGEAALSLYGMEDCPVKPEVLKRWLSKALDIYGGMFPYYGTSDGGWAEGTFYSTSYTKWYLPFFSCVDRCTANAARFAESGASRSFFCRSFYRNYARFLLHFALPDHENHPFGDGYWCSPESKEWPGFFAQNPFRIYAGLSGLPEAKDYEKKLGHQEIYNLHLLDVFLPEPDIRQESVLPVTDADAFPEAGFFSLHSNRKEPETDLHLIGHGTKFGTGSHRNPDNGSFALYYGGTALISPSGYFGRAYGVEHHMKWLNNTKAHNAVLIDGVGQDFNSWQHTGKILECAVRENGTRYAVMDLSAAYPMLQSYIRTYEILNEKKAVITDEISADTPMTVTSCLHSLSRPVMDGENVAVDRNGIHAVICADGFQNCALSDRYDTDLNAGVPEPYHVVMPEQFHIYFETGKKTRHLLRIEITL